MNERTASAGDPAADARTPPGTSATSSGREPDVGVGRSVSVVPAATFQNLDLETALPRDGVGVQQLSRGVPVVEQIVLTEQDEQIGIEGRERIEASAQQLLARSHAQQPALSQERGRRDPQREIGVGPLHADQLTDAGQRTTSRRFSGLRTVCSDCTFTHTRPSST